MITENVRHQESTTTTIFSSLLLVDDQIVVAQYEDEVNYIFRKLVQEFEKCGLERNIEKIQHMLLRAQGLDLNTDKCIIKHTEEYNYQETTITSDSTDKKYVQNKTR